MSYFVLILWTNMDKRVIFKVKITQCRSSRNIYIYSFHGVHGVNRFGLKTKSRLSADLVRLICSITKSPSYVELCAASAHVHVLLQTHFMILQRWFRKIFFSKKTGKLLNTRADKNTHTSNECSFVAFVDHENATFLGKMDYLNFFIMKLNCSITQMQ